MCVHRFTSAPILTKLWEVFQVISQTTIPWLKITALAGDSNRKWDVCRLLACWSMPGYGHCRLKPMAASVVICQHVEQGDLAGCTNPFHTDPITHQSSFHFEIALFGAEWWSWLMWLNTVGWKYICHLWALLSRACFFKFLSAVTTMIPNNANVYQNKK